MISNRLKNIIMIYCLALLIGVCTVIFIVDNRNNPETGNEDITQAQLPGDTDRNGGMTENWKAFLEEFGADIASVDASSSVLIKKPEAADGKTVSAYIAGTEHNALTLIIDGCKLTSIDYTKLERRAGNYYYNAEPPKGSLYADGEDDDIVSTLDLNNIASDIYGDPLRGLMSNAIPMQDESYRISVTMTFDREYAGTVYETPGFILVSLKKVQ